MRFAESDGYHATVPEGKLDEVHALRWTDANLEKMYRLQRFGGRMLQMGQFGDFPIPLRVELGNHFGIPDYAPSFRYHQDC